MPRPDLAALGVKYRRTPTMAIGKDIYLDSRMIIQRLEEVFPASDEHPGLSTPGTAGLAALLNKFAVDASFFNSAVGLIPLDVFKNEAFMKDRAGFFGGNVNLNDMAERKKQGTVHARQCFDIIESLFADGREWVGGTGKPTLADLEGRSKTQTYFSL